MWRTQQGAGRAAQSAVLKMKQLRTPQGEVVCGGCVVVIECLKKVVNRRFLDLEDSSEDQTALGQSAMFKVKQWNTTKRWRVCV